MEPQLEQLPGVASANVDGGKIRQITVNLNRDLLQAKGISVPEVARVVNDSNFLLPSGDLKLGSLDYNVFTNNQFSVVEPMENIVVRRVGGTQIRVRDLGRVEDSWETQQSVVRVNGERARVPAGEQAARGQHGRRGRRGQGQDPNPDRDARRRQHRHHARPVHLHPPGDREPLARGLRGSVLAFLVILFFLRSFVSTLIISIAIPLSILLTLVAMYFLGQTLNVFTLGGLALAVGRLVDDSIVELENINRHLNIPGKARRLAVLDAAREVAMPIFVSTITTIIVFLPTVFLEGQSRLLFIPLTFTISFSLFASFLVSRTVTPLLCLHWLKPERPLSERPRNLYTRASGRAGARFLSGSTSSTSGSSSGRSGTAVWLDRHRPGCSSVSAVALVPLIGTEFFPPSDESQFIIRIRAPVGTRVEETERIVRGMEAIIRATLSPGRSMRSSPSSACPPGAPASSRRTPGRTRAHPGLPDHARQAGAQRPRDRHRGPPALRRAVPGDDLPVVFGGIVSRVLNFGSETARRGGAARLRPQAAETARAGDRPRHAGGPRASPTSSSAATRTTRSSTSWWTARRRPPRALSQRDIAQTALFSLNWNVSVNPSIYTDPRTGNQYNVVVQLDEPYRSSRRADLGRLFVIGDGGRPVLLGSVAEIRAGHRAGRGSSASTSSGSSGSPPTRSGATSARSPPGAGGAVPHHWRLPPGFSVRLGGQTEQQREAFGSLYFTSLLALILVYMVLASQFRSLHGSASRSCSRCPWG